MAAGVLSQAQAVSKCSAYGPPPSLWNLKRSLRMGLFMPNALKKFIASSDFLGSCRFATFSMNATFQSVFNMSHVIGIVLVAAFPSKLEPGASQTASLAPCGCAYLIHPVAGTTRTTDMHACMHVCVRACACL